ncbi:MAG: isochorismate synthase [bacterium]|nr:isochorismate synthase [bacterium]
MSAPSTLKVASASVPASPAATSAPAAAPTLTPVADVARLDRRAWLEHQLAEHAGSRSTLMVSIPAPVVEPEILLEVSSRSMGVVWDPPDGLAFAGVGAVYRIQLAGPDRFRRLEREAEQVWGRLVAWAHPECLPVSPRLYGGLAFDLGAAHSEPWQEFGDGCFTLPRLAYVSDGERAALSLAVRGDELTTSSERLAWVAEVESLLPLLAERQAAGAAADARSVVLEVQRPSRRHWRQEIEAIRGGIRSGAFQKIVAARHSRVELARAPETAAVLRRLSLGLRASTRFAFCRESSTFLGATPERLVTRRGRSFVTEALAGSIASGGEGAERLLRSDKDRREHQLVVDEIVRRLGPLSEQLEVGSPPRVRELRDVLHLLTPVTGTLAEPRHVLELVEELHPTPAVGGVPTETAMRWISEHERSSRGWYAAPVGWFDAEGDGDFAVALRSCVLRGAEAFLYAGAGIVRDSDPELEYTETELKKQALLTALGA